MSSSYRNRATTQAHDAQVIAGIKKDLQNVSSLPLAGSTYTLAALEQVLQGRIDAANAAAAARANWLHASATYEALDTQATQIVRGLRQYVMNAFGESSPLLADFGFTPPKKPVLTPEALTARSAKAAATRKARGTLGKKAKAAIKGNVVGVTVTPALVTTPSTNAVGGEGERRTP
jgi:lysozyme family protein